VLLALLILICWPIAEVLVAIQVAHAIGVLATVVLLIAGWPIGTWALRSQGRVAWRRLTVAVSEGRAPTREVLDGVMILIGGAMLMIPGFITDVVGACLLLGPTRSLMRPLMTRNLQSRFVTRAAGFTTRPGSYDVDSTATDIDQPQLHR
jgi:UPF0716 protein FxsA